MSEPTLHAKDFFVSELLSLGFCYTSRTGSLGLHSHDFTEIAIIFDGEIVHKTNFRELKASKGDVLIIPRGGRHSYLNENNIKIFNILFDIKRLPIPIWSVCKHPKIFELCQIEAEYCNKINYYPRFKLSPEDLKIVKDILLSANNELEKKSNGYQLIMLGAFFQILPILLRNFGSEYNTKTSLIPTKISEIIDYINNNFSNEIDVNILAKRANLSPITFSRHFKMATGYTPYNYILKVRLDSAIELLKQGNSIVDTTFLVGFKDTNYFSRVFKKYIGASPSKYLIT